MRRPRCGLSEAERVSESPPECGETAANKAEADHTSTLPKDSPPGFPDMAVFRERLGIPVHEGNTVVEMREDERS